MIREPNFEYNPGYGHTAQEEKTVESADVKKLLEKIQLYEGELNNILSGVLITDREFLRPDFMTPKEDFETDRLILGSALL